MRRGLRAAWAALTRHGSPGSGRRGPAGAPRPRLGGTIGASLVEAVENALVVTDTDLRVLHWNGPMERLTGLGRDRALARPLARLLPMLDAIGLPQHLQRALGGEVRFTAEVSDRLAPRARSLWIDARCVPLHDDAGRLAGAAGFLVDTTELRRRALFVRAMEAIGRSLTSSLDLNEVLDLIVGKAQEVMAADSAIVVSWDGQAPRFRVMRLAGRLSGRYAPGGWIPIGGGPLSVAVLQAQPVTTPNLLEDSRFSVAPDRRAEVEREGFKAVAAVPLALKGRVHGALAVHHWTERTFSDEEVTTLTLLAEQAAIAIDNARLYADATRQADRLRELAEVERLITATLDLDQVLRAITDAAARLMGAPVAHIWTAEPGARVLRLRAATIAADLPRVDMPATIAFGQGITGIVAERRAAILVPDASEDPRVLFRAWTEAGLKTILTVPILAGDSLLGVVTVRARPGALSLDEDEAFLTSLAARAALAIQNARAYADAVRRATRLRDLASVSQSVTASLDAADVMQQIARAAAGITPGAMTAVHVLDPERNVLRYAANSGSEWEVLPKEFPVDRSLAGLVVERRAPVLAADPAKDPRTFAPDWWLARPGASYYGVPIFAGEALVGVLGYVFPHGVPDEEEQEALRLLAAYAGIAIRNASLYQAERAQAGRLAALAAINQRISGSLDLDDLLRRIAESAASLAGVKYASFWLADEERQSLTMKWGSVPGLAEDFPQRVVDYDFGGAGWIARHRRPLVADNVFDDPRIVYYDWWRRWGVSAYAGYPVLAGDELLAVLVLTHTEPIRFSPETQGLVDMFIAQASVAIQNARLYHDAQHRREVAEALARVGREVTASLDVEHIAEQVARGVVALLDGRGAAVWRYEPADDALHAVGTSGPDVAKGDVLRSGEGLVGRAIADRRVVTTRDIFSEPGVTLSDPLRRHLLESGHRAVIAVPLMVQDRIVGALGMTGDQGRLFPREEVTVLEAFADQAALALENARLYASAQDSLARLRDTQAQLVQVAKMSALGQLVSGVAHELNNPLSVIIGYGQLLLHREVPETLRRPLELIVAQGDRMAKIVRNLLYFARQRPPERAPVDLHQVIEQALALRLNQLALSGIAVEKDFAPDLPRVSADAQQLQQVFLNLLLNAEQAIGGGGRGGRIALRTGVLDGGRAVRAQVIDDGPGVSPEALPRVFEPFFTTKEVGVGTGLGLSVSYGIVEEHGGRLTVASAPGETVFTLELPVGAPTGSPAAPGAAAAAPFAAAGRAALVVEDEPGVADLVVSLLRDTGWRVDVAPGGRAGLARVRERRYDLIVSDIRMPDGSGEDFYREAVQGDPALGGRFLIITGDTANARALEFVKREKLPVLEKPFAPDRFLEAVRRVASSLTASGSSA